MCFPYCQGILNKHASIRNCYIIIWIFYHHALQDIVVLFSNVHIIHVSTPVLFLSVILALSNHIFDVSYDVKHSSIYRSLCYHLLSTLCVNVVIIQPLHAEFCASLFSRTFQNIHNWSLAM